MFRYLITKSILYLEVTVFKQIGLFFPLLSEDMKTITNPLYFHPTELTLNFLKSHGFRNTQAEWRKQRLEDVSAGQGTPGMLATRSQRDKEKFSTAFKGGMALLTSCLGLLVPWIVREYLFLVLSYPKIKEMNRVGAGICVLFCHIHINVGVPLGLDNVDSQMQKTFLQDS